MYTPIEVKPQRSVSAALQGHTYDISEGGAQFELDKPIPPGTPLEIDIILPMSACPGEAPDEPTRAIKVFGNVVWVDESEPGPARMAVVFTKFAQAADRDRLLNRLASRRLTRAA